MLGYVLDVAVAATGRRPVVVTSPATAAIRDVFAEVADFALQADPIGTGDAVRAGLAAVPADADVVLVLNGDVPRLHPELPGALLVERRDVARRSPSRASRRRSRASSAGSSATWTGQVSGIVEAKDATDEQLDIGEINAGIYAFDAAWLRRRIGDLRPSPATGEIYLTDLVRFAHEDGAGVSAIVVEDDGRLLGINDRLQLAEAEGDLRAEINERHLLAGVTMLDPSTAYVEPSVELAQDVTLEANVRLRGRTRVGEGTTIGAGSDIVDTVIGRDCRIDSSVVEASVVGDEVRIGPFAHVRPGSTIGNRVKIGNFAEIKNTRARRGRPAAPHELPRRRRRRRPDERRGRHDHRQLRRDAQAPDADRRAGLPGRRLDARRAARDRRRGEDRGRRGRHPRRARRQARGRRARPDPGAAGAATRAGPEPAPADGGPER